MLCLIGFPFTPYRISTIVVDVWILGVRGMLIPPTCFEGYWNIFTWWASPKRVFKWRINISLSQRWASYILGDQYWFHGWGSTRVHLWLWSVSKYRKISVDALLEICVNAQKMEWEDAFVILLVLIARNLWNLTSNLR